MKRYLIAILISVLGLTAGASAYYFFAAGGSTVSLPVGTTSYTPQFRKLGADSLRQIWMNSGTGWNRVFTATEINKYYFPRGARTYADSTRLYGTVLPTYATLSGSETLTNKTISAGSNSITMYTLGAGSGLTMTGGTYNPGVTNRTISLNLSQANTWLATQAFITQPQGDNSTKAATTAYVDLAVTNAGRGRLSLSGNVAGILNYDYLNATANQYTITPPATTGFNTDGSKIITVLVTGTGSVRISCPTGYTIQTASGFVTPTTGYATINQFQKLQLIPVGTNAYYLQVLNGSATIS